MERGGSLVGYYLRGVGGVVVCERRAGLVMLFFLALPPLGLHCASLARAFSVWLTLKGTAGTCDHPHPRRGHMEAATLVTAGLPCAVLSR